MSNVSLKEYVESRLIDLEKSIKLANTELNRRLEGMNEFRSQLKDQASSFITRPEYTNSYSNFMNCSPQISWR
jgi:hypothetical protein